MAFNFQFSAVRGVAHLFLSSFPTVSLAVSVAAVLKVVIIESRSVSSLFIMVRGANFIHIRIFQIFEVRLESCVFWRADSFQAKAQGCY